MESQLREAFHCIVSPFCILERSYFQIGFGDRGRFVCTGFRLVDACRCECRGLRCRYAGSHGRWVSDTGCLIRGRWVDEPSAMAGVMFMASGSVFNGNDVKIGRSFVRLFTGSTIGVSDGGVLSGDVSAVEETSAEESSDVRSITSAVGETECVCGETAASGS